MGLCLFVWFGVDLANYIILVLRAWRMFIFDQRGYFWNGSHANSLYCMVTASMMILFPDLTIKYNFVQNVVQACQFESTIEYNRLTQNKYYEFISNFKPSLPFPAIISLLVLSNCSAPDPKIATTKIYSKWILLAFLHSLSCTIIYLQ